MEVLIQEERPVAKWTISQVCFGKKYVLATLSVSVVSMLIGFSLAYTGSVMEALLTSFDVHTYEIAWIGTLVPAGAIAGGLVGGLIIEYIGRKNTIIATIVSFIISWLLIGFAENVSMVKASRAISGFCIGIASMSLPVYLVEIIKPEVRGTLGIIPTAFMNIGILLCYIVQLYINWSMMAFLGGALSILSLVLMFFIPETPRWCVSVGHTDRARKALVWLKGKEVDVDSELHCIIRAHTDTERHAKNNMFLELIKPSNLKPLFISMGLMLFQQVCGINIIMFYSVSVLNEAGVAIDGNICIIFLGVIMFIPTILATILIDRLGRKVLLYISNIAMISTLFVIGGFFYAKDYGIDLSQIGWLILASFVIYIIGFSLGFEPIPSLMMGEILPAKIRGPAAGITMAFSWLCVHVTTSFFSIMVESIQVYGVFWLYGYMCVIALLFVRFCVPETKGKTLENIEDKITGRKRTMSSEANVYPQLLSV